MRKVRELGSFLHVLHLCGQHELVVLVLQLQLVQDVHVEAQVVLRLVER